MPGCLDWGSSGHAQKQNYRCQENAQVEERCILVSFKGLSLVRSSPSGDLALNLSG